MGVTSISYPFTIGPLAQSNYPSSPRYTVTATDGPQLGEAGTMHFVIECIGINNPDGNVSYDGRYLYRYSFCQDYLDITSGASPSTLTIVGSLAAPSAQGTNPASFDYRELVLEAGWVYLSFSGEGGFEIGSRYDPSTIPNPGPGDTLPTEVAGTNGFTYLNPSAVYPWNTQHPVSHLDFRTETVYSLSMVGPQVGKVGILTFVPTFLSNTERGGGLPGAPRGSIINPTIQFRQADGSLTSTVGDTIDFDFDGGSDLTLALPAGWTQVTWYDQDYDETFIFVLGVAAVPDPGTGPGGASTGGITLLGSVDSHAGQGSGELRGFQSGPQAWAHVATGSLSMMSQWIVRDSGRGTQLAGATYGTTPTDPTPEPEPTPYQHNFYPADGGRGTTVTTLAATNAGLWRFRIGSEPGVRWRIEVFKNIHVLQEHEDVGTGTAPFADLHDVELQLGAYDGLVEWRIFHEDDTTPRPDQEGRTRFVVAVGA